MQLATSKQLWKLNTLAQERIELIAHAQLLGDPPVGAAITEIYFPLDIKMASDLIANAIQSNNILELWIKAHSPDAATG